jgi:hypothetical protein
MFPHIQNSIRRHDRLNVTTGLCFVGKRLEGISTSQGTVRDFVCEHSNPSTGRGALPVWLRPQGDSGMRGLALTAEGSEGGRRQMLTTLCGRSGGFDTGCPIQMLPR